MVAKIKFSQPSHYDIYHTATPRKSQGGCEKKLRDFLVPEITGFDCGLAFSRVVVEEVAAGDRL